MNDLTDEQICEYGRIAFKGSRGPQPAWGDVSRAVIEAYLADHPAPEPRTTPWPWVSVKDRLPEPMDGNAEDDVIWLGNGDNPAWVGSAPWHASEGSSHWMPFPPAPVALSEDIHRENFEGMLISASIQLGWKDGKYLAPGIEDMWQGYLLAKTNETSK